MKDPVVVYSIRPASLLKTEIAKKPECQSEQDHAATCFVASQAALASLGSPKRSAVFSGEQTLAAGTIKSMGLSSRDYALL
eukprot:3946701-Amphidinium_carterae.1